MPKINQYYIKPEIKKPVEIVHELNENNWWLEKQDVVKKSSLSPSARSKVISKSGSSLQSEKESYGPCEYYGCPYSSSFYLKIGFSCSKFDFSEYDEEEQIRSYNWIIMENIQQARNFLSKLKEGNKGGTKNCYYAKECVSLFSDSEWSRSTRSAREKQREIMLEIKNCINSHERGNEVYNPLQDFSNRNNGDCSGVIM